jgi:hypothetical protein
MLQSVSANVITKCEVPQLCKLQDKLQIKKVIQGELEVAIFLSDLLVGAQPHQRQPGKSCECRQRC